MEEYLAYKKWWMENEAPQKMDWPHKAFAQHVKDIGLYYLMETLAEGWVNRSGDKT